MLKKRMEKTFLLLISFSLLISIFAPSLVGAQESISYNEEVEELADALEYMVDEVANRDQTGDLISIDIDKIESMFADNPEMQKVFAEARLECENDDMQLQGPALDNCLMKKIQNGWKDAIGIGAIATAIDYMTQGKYIPAAKKLITAGIRGNAITVAATLTYWLGACLIEIS